MVASNALKIKRLKVLRFLTTLFLLAGVASALNSCSVLPGGKPLAPPSSSGDLLTDTVNQAPAMVDSLTRFFQMLIGGTVVLTLLFPQTRAAIRWLITSILAWITQWFQSRTKEEFRPPGGTS